ncbi:hypothetical protein GALMADRAFT_153342 [Galerina marginata CBS 339.88]|uniref:F-box domain-containing protein n=1 Tax=Galerina marginata (strain CBS 339.88) TaxID=685588 RepID=A0A067TPU0_GALM3|nr:hypothetical protein GALMADRAFT_153342 [Galerina marginata CBS 339.88]
MAERRVTTASSVTAEGGFPNHLPNEIVAKIFLAGTEIWRELDPLGFPFPVLVSGVCSHWRLLSQGTPELWTFLLPQLRNDPEECLRWTSNWLERSGAMLVSIVIDDRTASGPENLDTLMLTRSIVGILGLVANNIHRLHRLDILTTDSSTFEDFTKNLNHASHLRHLSLCARNSALPFSSFVKSPENSRWSSLQLLPSLASFRFQNISPPLVSNITSLNAHSLQLDYEDVQKLFTACPNLADLVLPKVLPISGPIPTRSTPIEVPSLRSIAVSSHSIRPETQAIYLFSFIVVPNLVYLEVEGNVRTALLFSSSLSSSKLRTLRVAHCSRFSFHPQGKEDIKFYQSFSTLHHLELIRAPAGELLLKTSADRPRLERRRSINLRMPTYRDRPIGLGNEGISTSSLQSAESQMLWPELRSITLDSFLTDDLVSLVSFAKIHEDLQSIRLSKPAMRHLSESLRRNGDVVFTPPSRRQSPGIGSNDVQGTKDVREWLSESVQLGLVQEPSHGLLEAE